MPKVMVKVIAIIFEYVVVFIFDLETGTSSGDYLGHVFIDNQVCRDLSIVVRHFAFGIGDGNLAPVKRQSLIAIA